MGFYFSADFTFPWSSTFLMAAWIASWSPRNWWGPRGCRFSSSSRSMGTPVGRVTLMISSSEMPAKEKTELYLVNSFLIVCLAQPYFWDYLVLKRLSTCSSLHQQHQLLKGQFPARPQFRWCFRNSQKREFPLRFLKFFIFQPTDVK